MEKYSWKGADKEFIKGMFNSISSKYDFLNHFLSFGIDKLWRSRLARMVFRTSEPSKSERILDVATGTADVLLSLAKHRHSNQTFFGVDISEGMLEIGRKKVTDRGMDPFIQLQLSDAERLPFSDEYFDAVTVAFGVRNFENLLKGLSEMRRVLRSGGTLFILEFSKPRNIFIKGLYSFYSRFFLPILGSFVSQNSRAYTYLPKSVDKFPYGRCFAKLLTEQVGFGEVRIYKQTFGIASIYETSK